MTRDEAAEEMGIRLSALLAEAAVPATDTAGGLKEALDDTLRLMGYGEADLATASPDDPSSLLTVLRYYTLRIIRDRLAVRFDISAEGTSLRLSQVRDAVEQMMVAAAKDVIAIMGSLVASAAADPFIALNLNFLDGSYYGEEFG